MARCPSMPHCRNETAHHEASPTIGSKLPSQSPPTALLGGVPQGQKQGGGGRSAVEGHPPLVPVTLWGGLENTVKYQHREIE